MNDCPYIPPAIRLIVEEDWGEIKGLEDFLSRYRRIAKEVATQAEWSFANFNYFDKNAEQPGAMVITASGGLNPFSELEVCSNPACRINAAKQLVRTLGIYADVIVMSDSLSWPLVAMRKPTIDQMLWLYPRILVLRELYPLMKAGIIRFYSPAMSLCSGCHKEMEDQVKKGAINLTGELEKYIRATIKGDEISIKTIGIMASPIIWVQKITGKQKKELKSGMQLITLAKEIYADIIEDRVHNTLFDLRFSEDLSSVLFSTSRRELYALRSYDGDAPALSNLAVWEKVRSVELPWVNKMTTQQVINLRNAASKALPGFRETFVRHIATPSANIQSVANKIDELRAEAAEVERELSALNPSGEENFRKISGSLGIIVSVYGFASGFMPPALALGGLMSILGLLHSSARHDEEERTKLIAKPAYVLMKAKELVEHAH